MLKTPQLHENNPILNILSNGKKTRVIEEGVIEIGHFSLDQMIWPWPGDGPGLDMRYPKLSSGVRSYGVCDSPEQFLSRFRDELAGDTRVFCVGFTHIEKDPDNVGKGGGWRWHKWGPYIGDHKPDCEYLDDEQGFDSGVWVYTILQTGVGP